MQNPKMVGRLTIPLAQLIDTENSSREFDVSMSVSESTRVNDEDPYAIDLATMPTTTTPISDDPYAIDITTMPTPMAAPSTTTTATFQDYVNDGCLLDFCVAIDFTSSNGKSKLSEPNQVAGTHVLSLFVIHILHMLRYDSSTLDFTLTVLALLNA
jgi:hypothetical protein